MTDLAVKNKSVFGNYDKVNIFAIHAFVKKILGNIIRNCFEIKQRFYAILPLKAHSGGNHETNRKKHSRKP